MDLGNSSDEFVNNAEVTILIRNSDLLFLVITPAHALFAPASKFHYWLISIA